MLRSLPSAIDDGLDTLYEPNAVFSQFLGSASIPFFSLFFFFPFLASSSFLVFSCFSCLFFLSFFVFFCFAFFSFLSFPSSFIFVAPLLQLTCVCRAYA